MSLVTIAWIGAGAYGGYVLTDSWMGAAGGAVVGAITAPLVSDVVGGTYAAVQSVVPIPNLPGIPSGGGSGGGGLTALFGGGGTSGSGSMLGGLVPDLGGTMTKSTKGGAVSTKALSHAANVQTAVSNLFASAGPKISGREVQGTRKELKVSTKLASKGGLSAVQTSGIVATAQAQLAALAAQFQNLAATGKVSKKQTRRYNKASGKLGGIISLGGQ